MVLSRQKPVALPCFVKECVAKIFRFLKKNGLSIVQIVSVLDFSVQIRNQPLKFAHVQNFSQIGQKIKGLKIRPLTIVKTA